MPALAAEVRSKNDTQREVEEKVERYLSVGVRVVWVADPKRKTVTVYRPGAKPLALDEDGFLTAEGIIPKLSFPVRRLFENLDE
jgi:Uma2 family endonuclease